MKTKVFQNKQKTYN